MRTLCSPPFPLLPAKPPYQRRSVKFKMAPNSLFAILLRSPWWASFAVAGLIVLVAASLLPAQYVVFGALGAVPITVVGCIAAWRQWNAPSSAQVEQALATALAQPWREFADTLERAWQAGGASVERLNHPHADFRLTQNGRVTLVSARRWKAATHGVEPLRQLLAAMQAEGASAGAYIAAQGTVSEAARTFANDNGLTLLPAPALVQLLHSARS